MSAPARLIDLSIARTPEYAARSKRLGTDYYMSPEQADPDTHGHPGFAGRRLGPGRHPLPRGRRLSRLRQGRPATPPDLPGRFPQLVDAPYDLPDRVPDAGRARSSGPRSTATRTSGRCPRRSSTPWSRSLAGLPAPRLTFKVRG